MESLYFVVGTLKANVPMVRVLDIIQGIFKDMTVENLVGCIKKGMLHIENATVENDTLVMIDGNLENYGVIVMTDKGVEVDPVAVVVSEIVDDNNEDIIIGYRMGNTDGRIYNYLIKDIQEILRDYPVANAEAYKDEQGVYWLKQGTKPLPKIKRSVLVASEQANEQSVEKNSVSASEPANVEASVDEKKVVEPVEKAVSEPNVVEQLRADETKVVEPVEKAVSEPNVAEQLKAVEVKEPETPEYSTPFDNNGQVVSNVDNKVEDKGVAPLNLKKPVTEQDTDWVIELKNGTRLVGDLDDIAVDSGLGKGYSIENGALLSDVQTGNNTIVSIKLPKGIVSLGNNIFREFKALEVVELPRGFKTVGVETFAYCPKLKEVKGTMIKIGRGAFLGCSELSNIDLSVVSTIEDYAFSKCAALGDVVLKQITVLGTGVFFASGLTRIVMGAALRDCGAVLFANCKSLVDVEFEAPVNLETMIEHGYRLYKNVTKADDLLGISFACMFLNCESLGDVNINADNIPKYNNYMFKGSSLYMPTVATY